MKTMMRCTSVLLVLLSGVSAARAQESSKEFQVGDRILLVVEGDTALSDTFTVAPGPEVVLPVIGSMSLAGVRRNQIETYMGEQLGRYLKQPTVRAKALVRLAVEGEVAHPGYYPVPTDIVLSDVLMAAGGLTTEAKMSGLKIDRAGKELMEGDELRHAVAQGRTVDQLGLRAGDRIYIPRITRRDMESNFRILSIVLGIPIAIYTITQIVN